VTTESWAYAVSQGAYDAVVAAMRAHAADAAVQSDACEWLKQAGDPESGSNTAEEASERRCAHVAALRRAAALEAAVGAMRAHARAPGVLYAGCRLLGCGGVLICDREAARA
jgi:hypothetical protein